MTVFKINDWIFVAADSEQQAREWYLKQYPAEAGKGVEIVEANETPFYPGHGKNCYAIKHQAERLRNGTVSNMGKRVPFEVAVLA